MLPFSIDKAQLWSLSACDGGFLLAFGATSGGSGTECAADSSTHPARCCADVEGSGIGDIPVPAPTKAPTPGNGGAVTVSASSCDELGWTNADKFGDSSVCGESDLNLGGCSGDLTWSEARAFCEGSGARLCSALELQADEIRGTGCQYDKQQVWTRSNCDGGFLLAFGATSGGSGTECAADSSTHPARCCADI